MPPTIFTPTGTSPSTANRHNVEALVAAAIAQRLQTVQLFGGRLQLLLLVLVLLGWRLALTRSGILLLLLVQQQLDGTVRRRRRKLRQEVFDHLYFVGPDVLARVAAAVDAAVDQFAQLLVPVDVVPLVAGVLALGYSVSGIQQVRLVAGQQRFARVHSVVVPVGTDRFANGLSSTVARAAAISVVIVRVQHVVDLLHDVGGHVQEVLDGTSVRVTAVHLVPVRYRYVLAVEQVLEH